MQKRDLAGQRSNTPGAQATTTPLLSLPQGGGAIGGIGETFAASLVTGTGSLSIPIASSPGRAGFGAQFGLNYDSASGNGPFGFGWQLSLPAISRRTERGLPQYRDGEESDDFLLSGADDLVPVLKRDDDGEWEQDERGDYIIDERQRDGYLVRRYHPRIEGQFARIERWTRASDGDVHWRTITGDNVLTHYGIDANSRIADPEHPERIFSWLICETRNDKGNAILYRYKEEDATGVDLNQANERNRGSLDSPQRTANRYLKHVLFGNQTPLLDDEGQRPLFLTQADVENAGWMFEVVFDYGEHDADTPTPADENNWLCRHDAFSSYRPGFEVRTYRLCQRVLLFHHFPDEAGVGQNCLVQSTDLVYRSSRNNPLDLQRGHPVGSFLASVTQSGYMRDGAGSYSKQSFPPLELAYQEAVIHEEVQDVDRDSLENLPIGLDGVGYHWVDLDGEGIAGILTEQAGAWFYKPNDGGGRFGPLQRVQQWPSLAELAGGRQQLLDLDGGGKLHLAQFSEPVCGFYERSEDADWQPFRPFLAVPNIAWANSNLRFIDLDGDGNADVLITEDEVFVWYRSQGEEGFGSAYRVVQSPDEERGPRLIFADGTESIYLADMCGDNLTDLVRVRNGEVCYWPNLGYGRFGAKVLMDNAPYFDRPDQFSQRRIRLADIDGSGVSDLIYLGADGVYFWFNQAGNSWSSPHLMRHFPALDDVSSVMVVDLLGNGAACLVWSSPLPGDSGHQMRYVDLMGGKKPHLLIGVVNNLGAETRIHYAPSTYFYLADKAAGRPWVTRAPFPVHVVHRVEKFDHVTQTRFTNHYTYHHGFYDGIEREFCGFGMVEQYDSESFADYVAGVEGMEGEQDLTPELYQPPVTTRTWFHTGAYLGGDRIQAQYEEEYYRQERFLPEPRLPAGLTADEVRECCRGLKGMTLRQEIYSFDGSNLEAHPYSVVETTFEVVQFQPRGGRHAVVLPLRKESVSVAYERNPADPRIAHTLNLEFDELGSVLQSSSVVYGRKSADPLLPAEVTASQQQQYITCGEAHFTTDIDDDNPDVYRLRTPYAALGYEITGIAPSGSLFALDELKAGIDGAASIDYEIAATGLIAQKRLLSHARILFRDNDLNPLALGEWDSLGLGYQSYELAFSPGVTAAYYAGEVTEAEFAAAGYVHFDNDDNWWIPSGLALYPANPASHFYLPNGMRDPLGVETRVTYDPYHLLVERVQVVQAPWNDLVASNDYRVLGPVMLTDPNRNRSAVELDALGMLVKTAVMGKQGGGEGDTLADPTTRMEYDLFNWMNNGKPAFVHTFAREAHGAANQRWQESVTYTNGSGGVALVKTRVHPGKALQVSPDGSVTEVDANPRWIGSGRTVMNNKGSIVKQYEPYFSVTLEYEDAQSVRELGVSPILFYDPLGRNIRTLLPNGTFTRVEFDQWQQKGFDSNDTVRASQWYADRGSPDPAMEPEPANDVERRAAWLAARHDNTPGIIHFDSLGRPTYSVANYGGGVTAAVRSERDLTGRFSRVYDQAQREVGSGFAAMPGIQIFSESAERGGSWAFINVLGAVVRTWDDKGRKLRTEYDVLHRPLSAFVQEQGQAEILFNHIVYGDRHPDAVALNLLGVPHLVFDQGGMIRVPELDFKGNPRSADRILARDYQQYLDWSAVAAETQYGAIQAAAEPDLEMAEVFTSTSLYDALNRPTRVTLPDGTVLVPTYNEIGLLARLQAQLRGNGALIEFLKEQDYNAKGQRQFARYGNDLLSRYFYDPQRFRLTNLLTHDADADPSTDALQDLHYTYDAVGNMTTIRDDAQQTYYFNNAVVKPESNYEYDALYQLVRATGREHAGGSNDTQRTHADLEFMPQLPHPNNAAAVRTYTEEYEYDPLGNIKIMRHHYAGPGGAVSGWTRRYRYAYEEQPANRTNRLSATSMPGDPVAGPFSATYRYDAYGNIAGMPHLASLEWNFGEQLRQVDLGGGGTAYYVYGAGGQRLRKVVERNGTTRLEWIFLGPVLLYRRRRRDTNALQLERWTVHLADNTGLIAQVDTKTVDANNFDPANPLNTPLIRYQYGNHLGSTTLETDENGIVVAYEEYHPYGTSAYRSARPGFDLSLRRFRFSGKERDDETGLYYFGGRYYAAWLGRWTSSDPIGIADGFNLYKYCRNNPVMLKDPDGLQTREVTGSPALSDPNQEAAARAELESTHHIRITRMHFGTLPSGASGWIADEYTSAEEGGGPPAGGGAASSVGVEAVRTNPEGHVHEVAQNFDDAKIAAYQERILNDRAVATRSAPPGGGSRTADIRAQNQQLRDNFEASLPGGQRPAGTDIDHTVELQDIGRHNNTVRPQDHRVQQSSPNRSQGSSQQKVNARRIQQGIPEDVPAGAVARTSDMANPRLSEAFRGRMRRLGYATMALGPLLTLYGASGIENSAVRGAGYGLGGAEAAGAGAYATGRYILGGGSRGTQTGLRVMSVGSRVARFAGGGAAIVMSTYSLINDIENENYGVVIGDVSGIVAGGAILAGSAPVAAIATGIGVSNVAGDWVESAVTPSMGREAGVAAGTLAGAGAGAAIGAAVGVWFFGVGAGPGALVGGAVGGIAGFIGAYW